MSPLSSNTSNIQVPVSETIDKNKVKAEFKTIDSKIWGAISRFFGAAVKLETKQGAVYIPTKAAKNWLSRATDGQEVATKSAKVIEGMLAAFVGSKADFKLAKQVSIAKNAQPSTPRTIDEEIEKLVQDMEAEPSFKDKGSKLNALEKRFADELKSGEGKLQKGIGRDIWRNLGTDSININGRLVPGNDKYEKLYTLLTFFADQTLSDPEKTAFQQSLKTQIEGFKTVTQGKKENEGAMVDKLNTLIEKEIKEKAANQPEYKNLFRLLATLDQLSANIPVATIRALIQKPDTLIQEQLFSEASRENPQLEKRPLILGKGQETRIDIQSDQGVVKVDFLAGKPLSRVQGFNQVPETFYYSKLSFTVPLDNPGASETALSYTVSTPEGGNMRTTALIYSYLQKVGVKVTNEDL